MMARWERTNTPMYWHCLSNGGTLVRDLPDRRNCRGKRGVRVTDAIASTRTSEKMGHAATHPIALQVQNFQSVRSAGSYFGVVFERDQVETRAENIIDHPFSESMFIQLTLRSNASKDLT